MAELLVAFPGAQRALFRKYHIGGCSSCGFQPTETVRGLCERNGNLDSSEVLGYVRAAHEEDQKALIQPTELRDWLRDGVPVRLLDIRSREEWDAARIAGAVLMTNPLMQEILTRWPRDQVVVVYDHLGLHALDAAAYFAGHGLPLMRALRGGIDAWSREIDPQVPRYRFD